MYKIGSMVKGYITGIEKYGIFVQLDNNYTGLLHISEISSKFVDNINNIGKNGDTIYARIIDIDEQTKKVKLSTKYINYRKYLNQNKVGIEENGTGFLELFYNLDDWIEKKLEEMDK